MDKLSSWIVGKFFSIDDEDTIYDDGSRFHWRVTRIVDVVAIENQLFVLTVWNDPRAAPIIRRWNVVEGVSLHDNLADCSLEAAAFNKRDNGA